MKYYIPLGRDRGVRALAADQRIVEPFPQGVHLVLDVEHEVLHAAVGLLQDPADGEGLACAACALDDDTGADQLVGAGDVW